MRLDFAVLADAVAHGPGKLYIHGAPLRRIDVPQLPWAVSLGVGASFTLEAGDFGHQHTLALRLIGPEEDAAVINAGPMPVRMPDSSEGSEPAALITIELGVLGLTHAGVHRVELFLDDEPLTTLTFSVVLAGRGGAPGPAG